MKIDLQEVQSSNISKIGYDAETETLYVKFKGNSSWLNTNPVWKYWPFPADKYQEFLEAKSVGQYFARNIRANLAYEAEAVREDLEETA